MIQLRMKLQLLLLERIDFALGMRAEYSDWAGLFESDSIASSTTANCTDNCTEKSQHEIRGVDFLIKDFSTPDVLSSREKNRDYEKMREEEEVSVPSIPLLSDFDFPESATEPIKKLSLVDPSYVFSQPLPHNSPDILKNGTSQP